MCSRIFFSNQLQLQDLFDTVKTVRQHLFTLGKLASVFRMSSSEEPSDSEPEVESEPEQHLASPIPEPRGSRKRNVSSVFVPPEEKLDAFMKNSKCLLDGSVYYSIGYPS